VGPTTRSIADRHHHVNAAFNAGNWLTGGIVRELSMRHRLDMTLALLSFYSRFLWVVGATLYEPLATRTEERTPRETPEEISWLSRRLAAVGATSTGSPRRTA
jgi:hypothetical protein